MSWGHILMYWWTLHANCKCVLRRAGAAGKSAAAKERTNKTVAQNREKQGKARSRKLSSGLPGKNKRERTTRTVMPKMTDHLALEGLSIFIRGRRLARRQAFFDNLMKKRIWKLRSYNFANTNITIRRWQSASLLIHLVLSSSIVNKTAFNSGRRRRCRAPRRWRCRAPRRWQRILSWEEKKSVGETNRFLKRLVDMCNLSSLWHDEESPKVVLRWVGSRGRLSMEDGAL